MKLKLQAVVALFAAFFSLGASAQPTLPSLHAEGDSGIVLLTWMCQYDGVKIVAVKRSVSGSANYKIVGYVKDTKKGAQAFVDGYPEVGMNYYKLDIIFNSGLKWASNVCSVFIDTASATSHRVTKGNDSLQAYLVATNKATGFLGGATGRQGYKVKISIPTGDMADVSFIVSEYVKVNKVTGHVTITLPEGFSAHTYSISFFREGKRAINVPVLKTSPIVVDKRNFQRRGKYSFELRKDGVLFESGYVNINL